MEGGERKRKRKGGEKGMTAPAGSAEELDEDSGREEGLPTLGGEWDEGEQGPGGRGELEEENGVRGRAKDIRKRRGAGVATKGQQPRHWRWGYRGEEPRGSPRPERNGARKSIQRSVIGRREISTIELWKATRS